MAASAPAFLTVIIPSSTANDSSSSTRPAPGTAETVTVSQPLSAPVLLLDAGGVLSLC